MIIGLLNVPKSLTTKLLIMEIRVYRFETEFEARDFLVFLHNSLGIYWNYIDYLRNKDYLQSEFLVASVHCFNGKFFATITYDISHYYPANETGMKDVYKTYYHNLEFQKIVNI